MAEFWENGLPDEGRTPKSGHRVAAGVHGDLPFSDPWWKILAVIVAVIAAIVAIIAAAVGEGTAGTAVSGTFDESTGDIDCCTPKPGGIPGDDSLTVAGVASVIATAAVAVALSDEADPWWRGQEATPPAAGRLSKKRCFGQE